MRGHYIPTPSYVIVEVRNSEISNSSKVNGNFIGFNYEKENQANMRDKSNFEIISSLEIINTTFHTDCEINLVKVKKIKISKSNLVSGTLEINEVNSVEIYSSKLNKHNFRAKVVRNIRIKSCDFKDIKFNLNERVLSN